MTTCYFQPSVTKHDNLLLSISSDETWQLVTFNQQELLTLPEHLSSPLVVSGVRVIRSLVLCVCFVDRCFSFCTFSFGHCVVCSSSICGFWLPIWHLQTFLLVIVLSVLLRFRTSDYLWYLQTFPMPWLMEYNTFYFGMSKTYTCVVPNSNNRRSRSGGSR